jgi:hypothetical protein
LNRWAERNRTQNGLQYDLSASNNSDPMVVANPSATGSTAGAEKSALKCWSISGHKQKCNRQILVNTVFVDLKSAAKGCPGNGHQRFCLHASGCVAMMFWHGSINFTPTSPFASISRIHLGPSHTVLRHLIFAFSSSKALNAMGQTPMLSRNPYSLKMKSGFSR